VAEPQVEWLDAGSLKPGRRLIDTPVIFFTPEYRAELRALADAWGAASGLQDDYRAGDGMRAAIEAMLEKTE
jgi:hypothetical protein